MKKILFLLLFAFSLTGFSQALGVLTGKIFEENQSPLFGATVVLEGPLLVPLQMNWGSFPYLIFRRVPIRYKRVI